MSGFGARGRRPPAYTPTVQAFLHPPVAEPVFTDPEPSSSAPSFDEPDSVAKELIHAVTNQIAAVAQSTDAWRGAETPANTTLQFHRGEPLDRCVGSFAFLIEGWSFRFLRELSGSFFVFFTLAMLSILVRQSSYDPQGLLWIAMMAGSLVWLSSYMFRECHMNSNITLQICIYNIGHVMQHGDPHFRLRGFSNSVESLTLRSIQIALMLSLRLIQIGFQLMAAFLVAFVIDQDPFVKNLNVILRVQQQSDYAYFIGQTVPTPLIRDYRTQYLAYEGLATFVLAMVVSVIGKRQDPMAHKPHGSTPTRWENLYSTGHLPAAISILTLFLNPFTGASMNWIRSLGFAIVLKSRSNDPTLTHSWQQNDHALQIALQYWYVQVLAVVAACCIDSIMYGIIGNILTGVMDFLVRILTCGRRAVEGFGNASETRLLKSLQASDEGSQQ